MKDYKLCESEYRFMTILWEHAPVPSGRLVQLCAERLGWKKPTTYTVIRNLSQRGIVKNEQTIVSALVSAEEIRQLESTKLVERTFEGSLPHFLTAFLNGKMLSKEEVRELEELIRAHEEK